MKELDDHEFTKTNCQCVGWQKAQRVTILVTKIREIKSTLLLTE
jgi:hypothetical protein